MFSDLVAVTAITFLLVFLLISPMVLQVLFLTRPKKPVFSNRATDPDTCRNLIAGTTLYEDKVNCIPRTLSRVLPYGKLRIAFGIDNPFCSANRLFALPFLADIRQRMTLTPADWADLSRLTGAVVGDWIYSHLTTSSDGTHRGLEIHLETMIQAVCLQMIMRVFLGARLDEYESRWIEDLAQSVNSTLQSAKAIHTMVRFEDNLPLQRAIWRLFPDYDFAEPRENPLSVILPAYEALWRSVFAMFLETGFGTGRGDQSEWQKTLVAFSQTPTAEQFTLRATRNDVSAEDLVSETLRIHPPVREIPRIYKFAKDSNSPATSVAADIRACHTSASIWGKDATNFKPARWQNPTNTQRKAYMPFGSRPFLCPAQAQFGPMIIGMIVGSLIDGCQAYSGRFEDETPWGHWQLTPEDARTSHRANETFLLFHSDLF